MRRILLVFTAMAVMVAMMAATALPAMATSPDRSSSVYKYGSAYGGPGACVQHRGGNSGKGQFFTGGNTDTAICP